ncbi:MAG: nucleotidyltransferase family protein [Bacteroidota bacterium]|nr:nucleotidyltransferase family protein [Bacteroidota bacterium]
MHKKVKKAMILAAGLGSRLKPWTDLHPKALARVNGKSLLQRNIEYLQQAGIEDVIINVHHFADQIEDAIRESGGWGSRITISDETDLVLETGGGLKKAAAYFSDTEVFVLMNVDILTDMDLNAMIARHLATQPLATLAVSDRMTSRYFLFDAEGQLCGWRNVQKGEEKIVRNAAPLYQKAFSGIHVMDTDLLSRIPFSGKFSMVDVYLALAGDHPILSYDHTGAKLVDVGKPESIALAEALFL